MSGGPKEAVLKDLAGWFIARAGLTSWPCACGGETTGWRLTTLVEGGWRLAQARFLNQVMCSSSFILQNQVAPLCQDLSKMLNSTWLPIALGLSNVGSGHPSRMIACLRVMCSLKSLYIIRLTCPFKTAPKGLLNNLPGAQQGKECT